MTAITTNFIHNNIFAEFDGSCHSSELRPLFENESIARVSVGVVEKLSVFIANSFENRGK